MTQLNLPLGDILRKLNKYPYLLLVLVFSACGSDTWTQDEKDEFVKACKSEGASSSYCDCYMEKVMNLYPKYDDADKIDFETAVELAKDCE